MREHAEGREKKEVGKGDNLGGNYIVRPFQIELIRNASIHVAFGS